MAMWPTEVTRAQTKARGCYRRPFADPRPSDSPDHCRRI